MIGSAKFGMIDILKDDIGTNYGLRSECNFNNPYISIERFYTLISRNNSEIKIYGSDSKSTFIYNINKNPDLIQRFNKDCFKFIKK